MLPIKGTDFDDAIRESDRISDDDIVFKNFVRTGSNVIKMANRIPGLEGLPELDTKITSAVGYVAEKKFLGEE